MLMGNQKFEDQKSAGEKKKMLGGLGRAQPELKG